MLGGSHPLEGFREDLAVVVAAEVVLLQVSKVALETPHQHHHHKEILAEMGLVLIIWVVEEAQVQQEVLPLQFLVVLVEM